MQKNKIISNIPKDKKEILKLWDKAILEYKASKKRSVRKRHLGLMRMSMVKIIEIALDNYGSKDEKIAKTFCEFYDDFLYWWLKDVGIDPDKWNEMENFFHKFPKLK